ncbi:hypothetical protein ANN_10655 [Periplaneta americana]|uniref:Uncharacterized protein n=1 Tax=Periplaneta americana TaxID=6978 RepID=A0ABQ8T423_PERAM|nr:hypothetical protein ANN_10655 [Periplaneta americana]
MLASRLKGWNLLQKNTKICNLCIVIAILNSKTIFSEENDLVFCNDISSVMETFGIEHNPTEWRLFIDSSKLGYTKYYCFVCPWDSRDRKNHYIRKEWLKRESFIPGQKNVKHDALCNPENVYLPPLHIKLKLMKNFVKAMGSTPGFMNLKQFKFRKISDAKIKDGIFVGPQIRSLMHDEKFEELLSPLKKAAWQALEKVTTSGSASPEVQSRSSRASSPDELTPTLCSDQCFTAATARPTESPSLMETSTQYSTATADAIHKQKCSNCMLQMSADTANNVWHPP